VPELELPAIGMQWVEFLEYVRARWRQGEHVALIGPTGVGKTTFAGHIVSARKYAIALDPKGGDSTLETFTRFGFERLERWPPPRSSDIWERLAKHEPVRLIVGVPLRTRADRVKLRKLLSDTIDGAFEMGGWTLYIDELQLAADRRLMGLTAQIEENLIAARDRGVSVVSSFQRPANVPRTASDQASHVFTWYTRDDDVVKRLAEMMGRPKDEIRGAIRGLDDFCILGVSRNPREPMIVTRVPKI
jgi:energy-coupling factor transporter ATP-binding protein EcfA2